jgi:hypothetical protein
MKPKGSGKGGWAELCKNTGIILAASAASLSTGQEAGQLPFNEEDPLAGNYRLGGSAEILWVVGDPFHGELTLRVIDIDGTAGNGMVLKDTLTIGNFLFTDETPRDRGLVDAVCGDFNGDRMDESLLLWEGNGGELYLGLVMIEPQSLKILRIETWKLSDLGLPKLFDPNLRIPGNSQVQIVKAQLDTDATPEVIAAWWSDIEVPDSTHPWTTYVEMVALDMDTEGQFEILAQLQQVPLFGGNDYYNNRLENAHFAVCAGQLDLSTVEEEILIAWTEQDPDNADTLSWRVWMDAYLLDRTASPPMFKPLNGSPLLLQQMEKNAEEVLKLKSFAMSTGDYDADKQDEAVVAWIHHVAEDPYKQNMRFQYVDWDPSAGFVPMDPELQEMGLDYYDNTLTLTSGFFNEDAWEDVAFYNEYVTVYTRKELATGHQALWQSEFIWFPEHPSAKDVAIADVDAVQSETFQSELVYFHGFDLEFSRGNHTGLTLCFDTQGDPPATSSLFFEEYGDQMHTNYGTSIVAGDFDGDSLQLDKPRRYHFSKIVQPIVVLHAPPTHYDVLDGQVYDINQLWPLQYDPEPVTFSQYAFEETSSDRISVEVSADWAVSAGLSTAISGNIGPVKGRVSASLDTEYGEGFSKQSASSEILQYGIEFEAVAEDRIFSTEASYDVFEYPVYANREHIGSVACVVPLGESIVIKYAKSAEDSGYISMHEPGNILSYYPDGNPGAIWGVGDDFFKFPTIEVKNDGTSGSYKLETATAVSVTSSVYQSLSARSEVSGQMEIPPGFLKKLFGGVTVSFGAYLQGDFAQQSVNTHSTELRRSQQLNFTFGGLDQWIIGEDGYFVTPFIYWANNGALVLDYTVEPKTDFGNAWWEKKYSMPDLAFTLLRRHNVEKGIGNPDNPDWDPQSLYRTANIQFNPNEEDEELTDIFARVHNYSLVDAPASTLRFYVGDPDGPGASLIENEAGISDISVEPLPARQYTVVNLKGWRIPTGVGYSSRIYAIIDPEGSMVEVHEDNNKGWTYLRQTGSLKNPIWPNAHRYPDAPGWLECWMGFIHDGKMPWVYHIDMHYLYMAESCTQNSILYWDNALGLWCWTAPNYWPYIYFHTKLQGWVYAYPGLQSPDRWFFHYGQGKWLTEAEVKAN